MPQPKPTRSELVLPPLSPVLVGRPYASVPLLAAYAEQHGSTGIRQNDLNRGYVYHLLASGQGGDAVEIQDEAERSLLEAALDVAKSHPADFPMIAALVRDPLVQAWLFNRAGLPMEEDLSDLTDMINRLSGLTDLRRFFNERYRRLEIPRLVGISVPFAVQLPAALLLADVLKEHAGPDVFVVLGGPLPSLLEQGQVEQILNNTAVDGVVRHEGEEAFRQLHELPEFNHDTLAVVPSLSFAVGSRESSNPPAERPVRLLDTRPHDFDAEYIDGAIELPVVVGRGCFYTCAFCDYVQLYERTNFRPVEDVIESVRYAAARSTTGRLHFVYEVMSLRYERKLVTALRQARLEATWRGFQRVYGELTSEDVRALEGSGCSRLDIGLESADDETLALMDKGYDHDEIAAFLAAFHGSSIQLLINVIVDYPGLTFERAMAAGEFLAKATHSIDRVHFEVLRFTLGRYSKMYRTPAAFGLDLAGRERRATSPTQVAFNSEWSMSEDETRRMEAFYRRLNAGFRERRADRLAGIGCAGLEIRPEPIMVARRGETVYVRRLSTAETFEVPSRYLPLLTAFQEQSTIIGLREFAQRTPAMDPQECVEALIDLDLAWPAPAAPRRGIRLGIGSDDNFYRGARRASSPRLGR